MWVLVRGLSHVMETITSLCLVISAVSVKQLCVRGRFGVQAKLTSSQCFILWSLSLCSAHSSPTLALSLLHHPSPEMTPGLTLPFLSDQEEALVCCRRSGKLDGILNRYILDLGWQRTMSAGYHSGRMSCLSPDAFGSCSRPADPGASASTGSEESG